MEKMRLRDILSVVTEIKRKVKTPLFNYYNNYNHKPDMEFDVIKGENTIIFSLQEMNVYRVFYYSSDKEELLSLLSQMPEGTILDIVVKDKNWDETYFEPAGFQLYSVYQRMDDKIDSYEDQLEKMSHNFLDKFYKEEYGEYATEEDLQDIQKIFKDVFDAKTDHLPTDEQLLDYIRKKWVCIYKENEDIICIFIFKIEGKKYYGNYTYNSGPADISYSLEKRMLLRAIKEYGVEYVYAWARMDNKEAMQRIKLSSQKGLYNYIYEKNKT